MPDETVLQTENTVRSFGWTQRFFPGRTQLRLFEEGLPILCYHKVGTPPRGVADPFLYVSQDRFSEHMRALQKAGFKSVTLDALFPDRNAERSVVITFDDGCENVLRYGLDALAREKFGAIQFLVSRLLGRDNEWDIEKGEQPERLMDVAQVKEWIAAGHQIGSHSATHKNLRHLPLAEAREEIFGSKKQLEDVFGLPIHHFSYPFGAWNERVRDLVGEAGYTTAGTMRFGVNTRQTSSPLLLNRIIPLSAAEYFAKARHRLLRRCARWLAVRPSAGTRRSGNK